MGGWEPHRRERRQGRCVHVYGQAVQRLASLQSFEQFHLQQRPRWYGVVPDQWAEQYGDSIAIRKLPEIGALGADAGTQAEQMDRLRVLASGGVKSNADLELLLEVMPAGKIAKGSFLAVLKELVARDTLAKAEKTVLEKRLIELNATRDAEGFGQTAQRDFVPGKEHRAENINAGQVTDRDGLPRVDD